MQKKHGKDGLVAMTLCVNTLDDPLPKIEKSALKWLQVQKVGLTNLLLSEKADVAAKKLHNDGDDGGYPLVFVFNRRGKWKRFVAEEHAVIDKYIMSELKAK